MLSIAGLRLITGATVLAFAFFIAGPAKATMVRPAMERAVHYLSSCQLPSGQFPSFVCRDAGMVDCSEEYAVFGTTFVIHALGFAQTVISDERVQRMKMKGLDFLWKNKEEDVELWRYWTKEIPEAFLAVSPDLDDTSCASAILYQNGFSLNNRKQILNYRMESGLFPTWTGEVYRKDGSLDIDRNEQVDCVVNANVLYYFSLLKHPLPEVSDYLNKVVLSGVFPGCSLYYTNKRVFYYTVTRAYAEGGAKALGPSMTFIRDSLIREGLSGSPLNDALTLISLINADYKGPILKHAVQSLVWSQGGPGNWKSEPFYVSVTRGVFFGSEALVTALVLEALSKYIRHPDINP